jgi:hypothetical protein
MKWKHHPNLRLRPHAPAAGRGRLQTQIRRAFIAANGVALSASTIYDWCYPRQRSSISWGQRWSVRRICRQLCERVGCVGPRHAILWKLRDPAQTGAEKGASR